MTIELQLHPAAEDWPVMDDARFAELKESIGKDGLRTAIVLYDGQILDGRHRYRACCDLGIDIPDCLLKHLPESENPFTYAEVANGQRRDIDETTRTLCIELSRQRAEAFDIQRGKIKAEVDAEGERRKREAVSEQPRGQGGTFGAKADRRTDGPSNGRDRKSSENRTTRTKVAKALGVGVKAVRNADQLKKYDKENGTDYTDRVRRGEMKPSHALRHIKEEQHKRDLERPTKVSLSTGLHRGDFRVLSQQIEDNSVELVFTDPPYDSESVPLYGDAAKVAARILKPGGSFIAYTGQSHFIEVLKECEQHLRYWWTIAGVHGGGNQIMQKLGIRCAWKPLVWFVKGTRGDVQNVLLDVVSGAREKDAHEWQQSEQEALYYIEKLTSKNGLVVDFFVGGGTTPAAAKKLGRTFIGFEISAKSIERASKRLLEAA